MPQYRLPLIVHVFLVACSKKNGLIALHSQNSNRVARLRVNFLQRNTDATILLVYKAIDMEVGFITEDSSVGKITHLLVVQLLALSSLCVACILRF